VIVAFLGDLSLNPQSAAKTGEFRLTMYGFPMQCSSHVFGVTYSRYPATVIVCEVGWGEVG